MKTRGGGVSDVALSEISKVPIDEEDSGKYARYRAALFLYRIEIRDEKVMAQLDEAAKNGLDEIIDEFIKKYE